MKIPAMYFYLQRTKTTPYALINDGYMKISGKAVPTDDQNFFSVIDKQLNKYLKEPVNKTCVDISLTHVNASSKKAMINMFKQLEILNLSGFQVKVNWQYDSDNEDVKELGEIFSELFSIEIHLVAKDKQ